MIINLPLSKNSFSWFFVCIAAFLKIEEIKLVGAFCFFMFSFRAFSSIHVHILVFTILKYKFIMRLPDNLFSVLELGKAMLAGQADDHELN